MKSRFAILFIGDIVGQAALKALAHHLPLLKEAEGIDVCIANAENAAGGLGLTGRLATALYQAGVDLISLGNHAWSKSELFHWIDSDLRMVRPLNGGPHWPGEGYRLWQVGDVRLLFIQLQGSVYLDVAESPFHAIDRVLPELKTRYQPHLTLIDFHSEATAEKITLAYHLDGKVTAVLGTHTHVQTADERILPHGTGFITDVGMTGPQGGVLGMRREVALRRLVERLPARYELAEGPLALQAVRLEVDVQNGRCLAIHRLSMELVTP